MRVLHIDRGRCMRGGQWQVLHLLRGLRGRGIDCTVAARGQLLDRARSEELTAIEATLPAVLAASRRTDLVHAHDAAGHTLAAMSRAHPLMVSRRVAWPPRRDLLSRWKYRHADCYLAVSKYVRDSLMGTGVPAAKIRVVYDGSPAVAPAVPDGRIVAIASDDPGKGGALLRQIRLPIAWIRNPIDELAGASVFLYLSDAEGLGSAVLLAMSAGIPVVASRVGGLPEVIEHEVTGLLVENNPAAVEAAVERLNMDAALRDRIICRAREQFESRFTLDHMVEATLATYREFLR